MLKIAKTLNAIFNNARKLLLWKQLQWKFLDLWLLNALSCVKYLLNSLNITEENNKINIDKFSEALFKLILKVRASPEVKELIQLIDIDNDGAIDKFDLETFLSRYLFLE